MRLDQAGQVGLLLRRASRGRPFETSSCTRAIEGTGRRGDKQGRGCPGTPLWRVDLRDTHLEGNREAGRSSHCVPGSGRVSHGAS